MQHDHFQKDIVWPFDPTPWVEGVSVGKVFAIMSLPAPSALIWYATWLHSEKDTVWPFDPTPRVKCVSVGKIFATMLLPASSALIWYATWLHSEKDIVWPFDPTPCIEGVSVGTNICYHVAASVVSFIFWKNLILASAPPPKSTQQARTQAFKL